MRRQVWVYNSETGEIGITENINHVEAADKRQKHKALYFLPKWLVTEPCVEDFITWYESLPHNRTGSYTDVCDFDWIRAQLSVRRKDMKPSLLPERISGEHGAKTDRDLRRERWQSGRKILVESLVLQIPGDKRLRNDPCYSMWEDED